jgi:zinc and cadmium transporter
MTETYLYIFGSVFLVSAISLLGIFFLGLQEAKLRKILLYLVSFSAGALLGDVFLHLLPEMAEVSFGVKEGFYFIIGILTFYVLEKFILWQHSHGEHDESVHSSVYLTTLGDTLHNFIDGMVIAAAFLVDIRLGIATTLAVVFHEIPQEIGQFGILLHGGWSKSKALFYNFLSALASVLGAVIVVLFAKNLGEVPSFLLAFAGASFIYIALSDIVPMLHKEVSKKRAVYQFLALFLGILFMAGLLLLKA